MTTRPFDKRAVRDAFTRAASTYDRAAVLQRTIADRLIERLDIMRLVPETVLDAGCGTGHLAEKLARRYRRARLVALDLSGAMAARTRQRLSPAWRPWRWFGAKASVLTGDTESLPLAGASVDLVMSNLTLQWCRPEAAFAEFRRVLRPGGLLMFTTFGPDTLQELRAAWRAADDGVHVHEFIDMHNLGDGLIQAGFAEPVMDVDRLTLTYPDVRGVMRDLRQIGAHNVDPARARGLTPKGRYTRFVQAYDRYRRDGTIPATYEVVYGHAWVPEQARTAGQRESAISFVPIRRR